MATKQELVEEWTLNCLLRYLYNFKLDDTNACVLKSKETRWHMWVVTFNLAWYLLRFIESLGILKVPGTGDPWRFLGIPEDSWILLGIIAWERRKKVYMLRSALPMGFREFSRETSPPGTPSYLFE